MELRNGFIENVSTYCDRWCETCPLTSWCRLFADVAEMEAAHDPHMKAVAEAAPPRYDTIEISPEIEKILEEVEERLAKMTPAELEEADDFPNEDDPLLARAMAYGMMAHAWVLEHQDHLNDPNDPSAVIAWFSHMIGAKINRALHGLGDDHLPDEPTDSDGSAKVALLGIERSRAAWEKVAAADPASAAAGPAIANLTWLEQEVERMFPHARRFVRPAFDEPDDVARLLAERDAAT